MAAGAGKAIISEKDIKYLKTGKFALYMIKKGKFHAVKLNLEKHAGNSHIFLVYQHIRKVCI